MLEIYLHSVKTNKNKCLLHGIVPENRRLVHWKILCEDVLVAFFFINVPKRITGALFLCSFQFQKYGTERRIRAAQDLAFTVALFIAKKNGSFVNYYMVCKMGVDIQIS